MEHAKKRAKDALIRRINNFKNIESIHTFVDETVEELWTIFDNEWAMAAFNARIIDCKGINLDVEKKKSKKTY